MKKDRKIIIENIRNIGHLEFSIPSPGVHILTGENGIGKSTLFTCLSRICDSNAYRRGFPSPKHRNFDEYKGRITYCVDNKHVTYTKRESGKWQPDTKEWIFDQFGFNNVICISTNNERTFVQELEKIRNDKQADEWIAKKMNAILNTDRFSSLKPIVVGDLRSRNGNAASKRRNTAFAIPLSNNKYYSEQNFSFGEIVLLNLLYELENAQENSLILIDELEMALHPSAQIRLIDQLKDLSEAKKLTVIVSTHSSSIIRSQKTVILLEKDDNYNGNSTNNITVSYDSTPARAIGAIGLREDSMADIIVLVEDLQAKAFFRALFEKYKSINPNGIILDLRIIPIGGWDNVISFYIQAQKEHVFNDNTFLAVFLDEDAKTPFMQSKNRNCGGNIHFLPYTPELFLHKTLKDYRGEIIQKLKKEYSKQFINYSIQDLPGGAPENDRDAAKKNTSVIIEQLSNDTGEAKEAIYNNVYRFGVNKIIDNGTINRLLAPTMKRHK